MGRIGPELWLKRELVAKRPDLRFAFSRPGLTTFGVDAARADEPNASSFARAYGRSLGRAITVDEVLALAGDATILHVVERGPDVRADERDATVAGTRATVTEPALRRDPLEGGCARGRSLRDSKSSPEASRPRTWAKPTGHLTLSDST